MLDINVKTIDGQNRSFSVPDNYTVKQFKERIATSLQIPVDRQRLIFQGRELKDASALNEFDVNGKTLHLVQRIPPNPTGTQSSRVRANTTDSAGVSTQNIGSSTRGTTAGGPAPPDVQNLIQQLLGGLGEFAQNATFTTTTTDGEGSSGVEVNIDLGNVSQIVNENEIRSRVRNIRRFLTMIDARLNRLREIQSGAPLDDNSSSTIIVGSIHTSTALSDGTNIIGFDTTASFNPITAGMLGDGAASLIQNMNQQRNPLGDILTPASNERNIDEAVSREASAAAASQVNTEANNQNRSATSDSQQEQEPRQQNIRVEVLADLVQNSIESCNRFMPFLQQYHDMLINDANEPPDSPSGDQPSTSSFRFTDQQNDSQSEPAPQASNTTSESRNAATTDNRRQRFCNNINDAMHLLGHLFHNLSDLHISVRDQPPRQIHTVNSMSHRGNNLTGTAGIPGGNATAAIIASSIPIEATFQLPVMSFPTNPPSRPAPQATTTSSANTTSTSNTTTTENSNTSSNPSGVPQMPTGATINAPIFIRRRPRSTQSFTSSPQGGSTRPGVPNLGAGNLPFIPPFFTPPPPMRGAASSLNPLSTNNSYDQYLPCSSVHFYNSFQPPNNTAASNLLNQRRRHPAGDNNQQQANSSTSGGHATASSASQPSQQPQQQQHRPRVSTATSSGPRANVVNAPMGEDQDLARLISNIVASTIRNSESGAASGPGAGPNGQQIRVNIGGLPGQISIATISTTHGVGQQPGTATPNSTPLTNSSRASPTGQNPFTGDIFSQLGSLLFPGASEQPRGNLSSQPAGNPLTSMINQLMGNLMDGNARPGSNQTRPASTTTTGNSGNARANLTQTPLDSLLHEAFNIMNTESTANEAQRQRLNQPMRNLFRLFDADLEENDSVDPATPTLNIFSAFFSAMSLSDIISLARASGNVINNLAQGEHNLRIYERARVPLRDYIRRALPHINGTTLAPNARPSESDLNAFATRLYTDLIEDTRHGLGVDLNRFEMIDPNVNFPRSFNSMLRHHFNSLGEQIFDETSDNTEWARGFGRRLADLVSHTVSLCRRCARNADAKLTEIILEKLREMMTSDSFMGGSLGGFNQIFDGYARTQLDSVLRSVDASLTNSPNLERFVVYRHQASVVEEPEPIVQSRSASENKDVNVRSSLVSSGSDDQDQYDSASSTISNHSVDMDSKILKRKKQEAEQSAPNQSHQGSSSSMASGEFPSDWTAVIEHDQRVQQSSSSTTDSGSFSDAYMSGMPAKKRKILSGPGGELSSRTLFKTVLSRTLKQVKLRASVREEDVIETSGNQLELIREFDQEIDTAFTERLRTDTDFLNAIKDSKDDTDKSFIYDDVVYNTNRFQLSRKRLN